MNTAILCVSDVRTYVRMPIIRQYATDQEAVHLRQRFHSDQASEGQLGWHGHDLLRECSSTFLSFVAHDDAQILYIAYIQ